MKLVTEKDELMRRYLLDEMSDEERNSIEEKFLEDDNFFAELAAVEDELYYDYKQNRLSTQTRIAFEKKFLATSQDIEKAEFAEALLHATEEISAEQTAPSLWQSIVAFFDFSTASFRLATGLASILLLFLVGFWILNNSYKAPVMVQNPDEINADRPTPTPVDDKIIEQKQQEKVELEKKLAEEKQKQEQDSNKIKELEKEKEKIQRDLENNRKKEITPPTPPTQQRTFIALVLSPSLVRSGGNVPKIKLTPELKTINLTLPVKKDFQSEDFKMVVRNIDSGKTISSSNARTGKKTAVAVGIPAKTLSRGAYEVVLITPDGEELDSYYFNVDK